MTVSRWADPLLDATNPPEVIDLRSGVSSRPIGNSVFLSSLHLRLMEVLYRGFLPVGATIAKNGLISRVLSDFAFRQMVLVQGLPKI